MIFTEIDKIKNLRLQLISFFMLLSVISFAQSFVERTDMYVPEHACDIKMISSTGWQMAWLKSATPYEFARPLTDSEIRSRGNNKLESNNWIGAPNTFIAASSSVPLVVPETDNFGALGYNMIYADCDEDNSTFMSSAAKLDFGSEMSCTTVEAAYLYWVVTTGTSTANYKVPYPGTPTMRSYNPGGTVVDLALKNDEYKTIKFKPAGDAQYHTVSATSPARNATVNGETIKLLASKTYSASGRQVCFADVTDLVQGKQGGLYWVADIHTQIKDQACYGWSLIVIYRTPNSAPRSIKFWDGNGSEIQSGDSVAFNLNLAGLKPASSNTRSYLGVAALDGENFASFFASNPTKAREYLNFQSFPGGSVYKINPFAFGQTSPFPGEPQSGYSCYSNTGVLLTTDGRDGISCSRLTTWDPEKGTNGNEINRRPQSVDTYGYDAHHFRLPQGAMAANATSAKMTYFAGNQGGTLPFLSYIAIETLQADLKLYMSNEGAPQPGSEMTYVLNVVNKGPRASKGHGTSVTVGSSPVTKTVEEYITDILDDEKVDFVPGSVVYRRGVAPKPFDYDGSNPNNEKLKFYLPSILAANGNVAQDSVVIEFKVKVKDLSAVNNNIWAYGCNRTVRNKASLTFAADNGDALATGSNATSGCGGEGNYLPSEVLSSTLQDQYIKTHLVLDTLTQAIAANPNINILQKLKSYLQAQYSSLNLNAAELSLYKFYTSDGIEVGASQVFALGDEAVQKYYAEADLGDGCVETFNFELMVAKIPKFNKGSGLIDSYTSCPGVSDGVLSINVSDGSPGYTCSVSANGHQIYYGSSPDNSNSYIFKIKGLKAGNYDVTVSDKGAVPAKAVYVVADPGILKVTFPADQTICTGSSTTLQATGSASGLDYVWKSSTQNSDGTWPVLTQVASGTDMTSYVATPSVGTTRYIVYACNLVCQASDTMLVKVKPTPVIGVSGNKTISVSTPTATASYVLNVTTGTQPYKQIIWKGSTNATTTPITISTPSTSGLLGTYSLDGTQQTLTVSNVVQSGSNSTAMDGYKYYVQIIDSAGCTSNEVSSSLFVVEGPSVVVDNKREIKCSGSQSGSDYTGDITFKIADGEPNQNYSVYLYAGSYNDSTALVQANAQALSTTTYNYPTAAYIGATNSVATDFTVVLVPSGTWLPGSKTRFKNPKIDSKYSDFKLDSPQPLVANLTGDAGDCKGGSVKLEASAQGGQASPIYGVSWEYSTDNGNQYNPLNQYENVWDITFPLDKLTDEYLFKITVTDHNACPQPSNIHLVKGLTTPDAQLSGLVANIDTGCYKYDLHNLPVIDANNVKEDIVLSLHKQLPLSALDNSFIIPESEYIITSPIPVFARYVVGGKCYSTVQAMIALKTMESCYPIYIPDFFSPDGDGINDLFQMENLEEYDNPKITIYDRFGKVVFEGGKEKLLPPNGWDGKYLGHPVPSGDYWYQMIFSEMKPKVGHFSLKRKKE